MAADYQLELIRKVERMPEITSFYFKKPQGFDYKSGQYVKATVPLEIDDSHGGTRFFTLSSSPTEDYLMITTKMQPSQFKKQMYGLQVGDLLQVRGPYGVFVFNPEDTRHRVYIAGGMGITPFRSMIRYEVDQKLVTPITLLYSFKTPESTVFLGELLGYAKQNEWLKFYPINTTEERRIDKEMIEKSIENLDKNVYYITGPTEMVDDVSAILEVLQVPSDRVFKEYFSGYIYE